MNLDARLRQALRHVEPPDRFAERVRARVEHDLQGAAHGRRRADSARGEWRSWMATAAAALLIAAGTYGYTEYEQRREALVARSQVLLALEITSRALENVHRQVVVQPVDDERAPRVDERAGGEDR